MYDNLAATHRHRFSQFNNYFLEKNIKIEIQSLLSNEYLEKKFNGNKISYFQILKLYFRRFFYIFKQYRYDLIIIHCELFPYFPYFIEKFMIFKNYIYDFDDAIYLRYKKRNFFLNFIFKNKFKYILKKAALIHAGSEFLLNHSLKYNVKSYLLPTSVDITRYKPIKGDLKNNDTFTIGWIGSPSSEKYLNLLLEPFDKLSKKIKFKFIIVGGKNKPKFKYCESEIIEWSYDNEINLINTFDIGIMPLQETDWEKGKCAFKLIQCMACEVPVIASPVGFNKVLISDSVDGMFAKNRDEWFDKILLLYNKKKERDLMGLAAREKILKFYSSDHIFSNLYNNLINSKLI